VRRSSFVACRASLVVPRGSLIAIHFSLVATPEFNAFRRRPLLAELPMRPKLRPHTHSKAVAGGNSAKWRASRCLRAFQRLAEGRNAAMQNCTDAEMQKSLLLILRRDRQPIGTASPLG